MQHIFSLLSSLPVFVSSLKKALVSSQKEDGHFIFELEADATIPAEYILLNHFIGDIEPEIERSLCAYLRAKQSKKHGGWPLFHEGDLDISCSVKAYYALKLAGEDPSLPHMIRAKEAILHHGGAEKANVFTRYALALFEQIPWSGVPAMPIELVLMPSWFPVTLWRVSYWSRTVIAPLLILASLKPKASNPKSVSCQELFVTPPLQIKHWNSSPPHAWGKFFLRLDVILQILEKHLLPKLPFRKRALKKALAFIEERANGKDGLGAIFPAMANLVMACAALGYPTEHPLYQEARLSIKGLLTPPIPVFENISSEEDTLPPTNAGSSLDVGSQTSRYCQPCLSPVWDTALSLHALMESGLTPRDPSLIQGCDWLLERQILTLRGDWALKAPNLTPGGWAFQYNNAYYPDVDDTAVVGMLLHRADPERYANTIARAASWVLGMQSTNGGFGAFDIDNTTDILNAIPFADHGALLDPPTADVTARCVSFLAQLQKTDYQESIGRALDFLIKEQEEDGSWFGRWGTNYIYGTWSVLCALNAVGFSYEDPIVLKAKNWLLAQQREDGGFGEDGATYWKERRGEVHTSTPSQTAWAILGLIAAGACDDPAVERAISYLLMTGREENSPRLHEDHFTAVGFPRVFYLKYHGYSAYFPLWALARYQRLKEGDVSSLLWGM